MPNNSRFDDVRRGIDHTADDARRIDVSANYASGIHCLEMHALPFAAVTIEIPPGKTILGAHDTGVIGDQWRQSWGHRRKTVRF